MKLFLDTNIYIWLFNKETDNNKNRLLEIINSHELVGAIEILWDLCTFHDLRKIQLIANFIDEKVNCWLYQSYNLKQKELRNYLSKYYFQTNGCDFNPYSVSFSQIVHELETVLTPRKLPEIITPKKFITDLWHDKNSVTSSNKQYVSNVEKGKKSRSQISIDKIKQLEEQTDKKYLQQLIFYSFPTENRKTKNDLINFCLQGIKNLYKHCPTIEVDSIFYQLRKNDPTRKCRDSDISDLNMSMSALPYVDYFITKEKHLQQRISEYKKRKIFKKDVDCKNLQEFLNPVIS